MRSALLVAVALTVGGISAQTSSARTTFCGEPANQQEGPYDVRAKGVSCRYALRWVRKSQVCRSPNPRSRVTCYDRGWYCIAGPGTAKTNYSIPVRCTRGTKLIKWLAGY